MPRTNSILHFLKLVREVLVTGYAGIAYLFSPQKELPTSQRIHRTLYQIPKEVLSRKTAISHGRLIPALITSLFSHEK